MGVKLLVVAVLALVMTIPALFVNGLIEDRSQRADSVAREIGGLVGGQQTFLGPILSVPYTIPASDPGKQPQTGVYIIYPVRADAVVRTRTEERHRSLFKVPVYQADLALNASFDLEGVPVNAPAGAQMQWSSAEIVVGASDPRGALADATLSASGKTETFLPSDTLDPEVSAGDSRDSIAMTYFGVYEAKLGISGKKFDVSANLKFSGAQRIAILAYGKTTAVSMQGDWAHPSFDGNFLPVKRTISKKGFDATWAVPFIARGVHAEGHSDTLYRLNRTTLGVSFVELADPYQSVTRSLKYSMLFIGLVFLSYFVFEVTTGKRVHPAQYVLIGVAQTVFYLLLLSFSERVGFDVGFAIAAGATVGLISTYAGWVFESRPQGFRALVAFSFLYALIYALLRLEDEALLVGAVVSFLAVAAAMYFTRGIDWYSSLSARAHPKEPAA
jgi:inner membrane protein